MITPDEALSALARDLETPVPTPDGKGRHVFELADDMRLGVEFLPGGAGAVAWSEVGAAEGPDAEEKAAQFLRLRLARLRGAPAVEAAREDGRLILFWRGRPETAREWTEAVAALLNEAEATRRVSAPGGPGAARPASGSLFSGLMGRLTAR
jgi:hypothetical protein